MEVRSSPNMEMFLLPDAVVSRRLLPEELAKSFRTHRPGSREELLLHLASVEHHSLGLATLQLSMDSTD